MQYESTFNAIDNILRNEAVGSAGMQLIKPNYSYSNRLTRLTDYQNAADGEDLTTNVNIQNNTTNSYTEPVGSVNNNIIE